MIFGEEECSITKYLYDFLCRDITDSVRRELLQIKDDYPTLCDDVRKWNYQGKTLTYYEELRKQYLQHIKGTTDANTREQIRKETAEQFRNVSRWYAFQFFFEEAYRERFAKEITINMLRNGKFEIEDIEQVMPYMSKDKITSIQKMLNNGSTDWEVICSE